jgi:hypothetical protein
MQYNVTHVLNEYGINTSTASSNKLTVLCPFHDDHNPSGSIDLINGFYNCWSCNRHTTLLKYLAVRFGKSLKEIYYAVGKLDSTPISYKIQDPGDVEEWHTTLLSRPECMQLVVELTKRGLNLDAIREHRLGAFIDGSGVACVRIPIYSKRGDVIGVKDYRPGAEKLKFTWPHTNCNRGNKEENIQQLLYPADQLAYPIVVICGGEIKAIAAGIILNSCDIGAVSGTGSESIPFTPSQLAAFKYKIVYVCYDIDATGIEGALKLCRSLIHQEGAAVHLIKLPLDLEKYPHGDVNDYIASGGNLLKLVQDTLKWEYVPPTFEAVSHIVEGEEPLDTTLDKAVSASMAKKKVKLKTVISSMDTSPYSIPKGIRIVCERGDHKCCGGCKIYEEFTVMPGDVVLSGERLELMEMVGQELQKQERILKKAFGIPTRCAAVVFYPQTFYHVEDVRVSQHLDIMSRTNERSMQAAYIVGEGRLELNEGYTMTGRMYPHPSTQQATLLISAFEAAQDALSSYVPTNLNALEIFRPSEWTITGIETKLAEIYTDLAYNVTHIYGRQDLHLLYDLAYHSVLFLSGPLKGWVEVLVVGDSAQGKTLCVDRLIHHYGLGERVICKGATIPGLLGGLQQHGKRWFASWGKIPTQDRRLVALDELKGTSPEVIAGLTDMRSSGIATLTKIEKRQTNARTRLIMISNPRTRTIREYNTGVEAIHELIGSAEDIRRFDAIMVVAQREVPDELIHSYNRPTVPNIYTPDLCRDLILYAWTVRNVEFEDLNYLHLSAMQMITEYVEDVPIVDSGTMSEKLMRLSAALAVRTFSIKDPNTVLVRTCHIDYILSFLKRTYSSPAFGYLEYSRKRQESETLLNAEEIEYILLNRTPFPMQLIHVLLISEDIDIQLISDILGWPLEEARNLLAFLNRHHALKRSGRIHRKTANFSRMLRELEERVKNEQSGRPEHIPDTEF